MPPTPTPTPTQTPAAARTETAPVWARATASFCKAAFDVRSREDFVDALVAFEDLSPGEQSFHIAHLVFRQVQAMEDVHRVLLHIDAKLGGLDPGALSAIKELPMIRKTLVAIARGQDDMLDLMETGAGPSASGDADDEAEEEGDDDDPAGSALAKAIDAEFVEEEDHGRGDQVEVVVPDEVLPAGSRPVRTAMTAEEALASRHDGGEP
jgi:hypothetical protein